jgi:hypothetical protein
LGEAGDSGDVFVAEFEDVVEAGVVGEVVGVELHEPEERLGVVEELVVEGVLGHRGGEVGEEIEGRDEAEAQRLFLEAALLAGEGVDP